MFDNKTLTGETVFERQQELINDCAAYFKELYEWFTLTSGGLGAIIGSAVVAVLQVTDVSVEKKSITDIANAVDAKVPDSVVEKIDIPMLKEDIIQAIVKALKPPVGNVAPNRTR